MKANFDLVRHRIPAALMYATRGLPYDLNETIVVSGSPRSGTTWLAQILGGLPGYDLLKEPLNIKYAAGNIRDRLRYGVYASPGNDPDEDIERYLYRALKGGVPAIAESPGTPALFFPFSRFLHRKLVVKFVRANRILSWLCWKYPVRGCVLILRNPLSMVASRKNASNVNGFRIPSPTEYQTAFDGWIPLETVEEYFPVFKKVKSIVQFWTIAWWLDIVLPLRESPNNLIVTSYERLLTDSENEIRRILKLLGKPFNSKMMGLWNRKSSVASKDLQLNKPNSQATKYQKILSSKEVDEIMEILENIGFDVQSLLPDPIDAIKNLSFRSSDITLNLERYNL